MNKELIEVFDRLGSFDFSLNFREAFERAVAKAEIQDFRFHDLRHTFASDLVIKGVDLYTVSKLLGHSTIEMTPLRHRRLKTQSKSSKQRNNRTLK